VGVVLDEVLRLVIKIAAGIRDQIIDHIVLRQRPMHQIIAGMQMDYCLTGNVATGTLQNNLHGLAACANLMPQLCSLWWQTVLH